MEYNKKFADTIRCKDDEDEEPEDDRPMYEGDVPIFG